MIARYTLGRITRRCSSLGSKMTCKKCNLHKTLDNFYPYRPYECKQCVKARTSADWRRRQAVDPKADQESRRAYHMMTKYRLSLADIEFLLEYQEDKCAICGCTEPGGSGTWHVDHDHSSNIVRGMLCAGCNRRLGVLENQEWRVKAESYLANPPALLVFQK